MRYENKTYTPATVSAPANWICDSCDKPISFKGRYVNIAAEGKNIGHICHKCYNKIKAYKKNETRIARRFA
jgi:hypothetical protein